MKTIKNQIIDMMIQNADEQIKAEQESKQFKWIVFYFNNKPICALTQEHTFEGETKATRELLAGNYNTTIENIIVRIETRTDGQPAIETEPEPTEAVIGYFNEYGYNIQIVRPNNNYEIVYAAGNNKFDSGVCQTVEPDKGLDLKTIKKFCRQTAQQIAKERGLKFLGIEAIE